VIRGEQSHERKSRAEVASVEISGCTSTAIPDGAAVRLDGPMTEGKLSDSPSLACVEGELLTGATTRPARGLEGTAARAGHSRSFAVLDSCVREGGCGVSCVDITASIVAAHSGLAESRKKSCCIKFCLLGPILKRRRASLRQSSFVMSPSLKVLASVIEGGILRA
jgi:hypothetical protein